MVLWLHASALWESNFSCPPLLFWKAAPERWSFLLSHIRLKPCPDILLTVKNLGASCTAHSLKNEFAAQESRLYWRKKKVLNLFFGHSRASHNLVSCFCKKKKILISMENSSKKVSQHLNHIVYHLWHNSRKKKKSSYYTTSDTKNNIPEGIVGINKR